MNKNTALKEALYILVPNIEEIFIQRAKKGSKILLSSFIEVISRDTYNLAKDLNSTAGSIRLLLTTLFPSRPSTNSKICNYILLEVGYKYCVHCSKVKPIEEFHLNSTRTDKVNTYCKVCQLETTAKTQVGRSSNYRAAKLQRTPSWSNLDSIKEFANACPEGYHVDHIVPLQGEKVSGLHTIENLQYLLASENLSKSNKY